MTRCMVFFAAATLVGACATTSNVRTDTPEIVPTPAVEEIKKAAPKARTSRNGGFYAKEDVEGPIKRRAEDIRICYEDQLIFHPKLTGRMFVTWTIGNDGRVTEVATKGLKEVGPCVAQVIMSIRFTPPYGVPQVVSDYPFVFNLP